MRSVFPYSVVNRAAHLHQNKPPPPPPLDAMTSRHRVLDSVRPTDFRHPNKVSQWTLAWEEESLKYGSLEVSLR